MSIQEEKKECIDCCNWAAAGSERCAYHQTHPVKEVACEGWRTPLGCKNVVKNGGVNGTGYCENCHRSIEDIERYRALRKEGYSAVQAGLMAGLTDPPE
jgi:hypothetical protein